MTEVNLRGVLASVPLDRFDDLELKVFLEIVAYYVGRIRELGLLAPWAGKAA